MAKRLAAYRPAGMSMSGQVRVELENLCREKDYCPIRELVDLSRDPDATIPDRIQIARVVSEYIYPKVKSFDPDEANNKSKGLNIVVVKYGEVEAVMKMAAKTEEVTDV